MKIFNDVLTSDLIENIFAEIKSKISLPSWAASVLFWDKSIMTNVGATVLQTPALENGEKILEQARKFYPKQLQDIKSYVHYYLWTKNSSISLHQDSKYAYGATIYLNKDWIIDEGGIFMWKDKSEKSDYYKAYIPKYNSMVLNDENEKHIVTPVNPFARNLRITIQIFGRKD